MSEGTRLYWVQLGIAARLRGDHVLCEVLEWVGTGQSLAKIRIVRSTLPTYHAGKTGVMQRERLIPTRRTAAAGTAA